MRFEVQNATKLLYAVSSFSSMVPNPKKASSKSNILKRSDGYTPGGWWCKFQSLRRPVGAPIKNDRKLIMKIAMASTLIDTSFSDVNSRYHTIKPSKIPSVRDPPFAVKKIPRFRACIVHHLICPGWKPRIVNKGPWGRTLHVSITKSNIQISTQRHLCSYMFNIKFQNKQSYMFENSLFGEAKLHSCRSRKLWETKPGKVYSSWSHLHSGSSMLPELWYT